MKHISFILFFIFINITNIKAQYSVKIDKVTANTKEFNSSPFTIQKNTALSLTINYTITKTDISQTTADFLYLYFKNASFSDMQYLTITPPTIPGSSGQSLSFSFNANIPQSALSNFISDSQNGEMYISLRYSAPFVGIYNKEAKSTSWKFSYSSGGTNPDPKPDPKPNPDKDPYYTSQPADPNNRITAERGNDTFGSVTYNRDDMIIKGNPNFYGSDTNPYKTGFQWQIFDGVRWNIAQYRITLPNGNIESGGIYTQDYRPAPEYNKKDYKIRRRIYGSGIDSYSNEIQVTVYGQIIDIEVPW